MDFPIPNKEQERLSILNNLNILDSLHEEGYDFITDLAAEIFDVPIALISFVDHNRQWFKSKIGLEKDSTPRDQAFCTHNILDDELMVVENAREDDRFKDNPLVTGDPYIVFYAGSPIKFKNEYLLGSVCIIDRKPRSLTDKEKELLDGLSKQVSTLLEMRAMTEELRQSHYRIQQLEHLIPICSWCRQIRNQHGDWQSVEEFFNHRDNTIFTHAICDNCTKRVRGQVEG